MVGDTRNEENLNSWLLIFPMPFSYMHILIMCGYVYVQGVASKLYLVL